MIMYSYLYQKKKKVNKISPNLKDGCFMLQNGDVAIVDRIVRDKIQCKVFKPCNMQNVYVEPAESKLFNIYLINDLTNNYKAKVLERNNLINKCVCIPEQRGHAIFPLLHRF